MHEVSHDKVNAVLVLHVPVHPWADVIPGLSSVFAKINPS